MKNSTIWKSTFIIALLFLGFAASYAQNSLTVNSQTLSLHGFNSTPVATALENTDSVAIGGVTRYYVVPDATANGSYTGVLTGSLTSSFNWTFTAATNGATGTPAAVSVPLAAFTNYRQVTWGATSTPATITLNVQEQSAAPANCGSGTTTQVPIAIIGLPTTEFTAATGTARCITGTDGSLTEVLTAIPVRFSSSVSGNRNLQVTYNVSCTNAGFTTVTGAVANVTETGAGAGTFNIAATLTHYGTYTVTITAINDRISTKSSIAGVAADVNTDATTQSTYGLVVNRTPVTGPIYHMPNQ